MILRHNSRFFSKKRHSLCNVLIALSLFFGLPVRAAHNPLRPASGTAHKSRCAALLNPHSALARILPHITDDQALFLLKANYSELLTWLSQKADATAEGGTSTPKGIFGPNKNLTPSILLFGADIVEVNRTAVGYLALKWILANDYETFTQNQAAPVRLSRESFSRLRSYVLATLKTPEDLDAMIVMILTNDLGKIKRYHELTEKAVGRAVVDHDEVLFVGFREWPEISPNFMRLSAEKKGWIIDGLKMGSNLNIGQFAQAENLPANLLGVRSLTGKPEAFEFKFIELLLDVAGANGHLDAGGAKVMIEPVYQNFMLARNALHDIITGGSVRDGYDQILIEKNRLLVGKGFRSLDVKSSVERAILRLLTLRRTTTREQAEELYEVFLGLPANARAILVSELNVDGTDDGWGTLPYYAPALINNALVSLFKTPGGSIEALRTVFLSLARVFQEARIQLKNRQSSGIYTVNVESLAKFALSDEYRDNPDALLNLHYELFQNGSDANQFGVKLSSYSSIDSSQFEQMNSLVDLPGNSFAVVGIGGGSDGVQAAQLALMLRSAGKNVKFIGSVRTDKTGSQSPSGEIGENRTLHNHGGMIAQGVYHVLPSSSGSGRFLENLPADELRMYLILDRQNGGLPSQFENLIDFVGGVDTLIAVDTGGDVLFPSNGEKQNQGRSTPDQDLRVISSLRAIHVTYKLSAIVAAGVDSPLNAQSILQQAGAQYYSLSDAQKASVIANYIRWQMDGTNENRFGKTPLAWQLALTNQLGMRVMPLPTKVVVDQKNPWNPFVFVDQSMSGVFFMHLDSHLNVIGLEGDSI